MLEGRQNVKREEGRNVGSKTERKTGRGKECWKGDRNERKKVRQED